MFTASCSPAPWNGAQLCPVSGSGEQLASAFPSSRPPWPSPEVCLSWHHVPGEEPGYTYFDNDSNIPHLADLCQFQSAFNRAFHLILTIAPQDREYYYPQFADEETEAQQGKGFALGPTEPRLSLAQSSMASWKGEGRAARDSGVQ